MVEEETSFWPALEALPGVDHLLLARLGERFAAAKAHAVTRCRAWCKVNVQHMCHAVRMGTYGVWRTCQAGLAAAHVGVLHDSTRWFVVFCALSVVLYAARCTDADAHAWRFCLQSSREQLIRDQQGSLLFVVLRGRAAHRKARASNEHMCVNRKRIDTRTMSYRARDTRAYFSCVMPLSSLKRPVGRCFGLEQQARPSHKVSFT